MARGTLANVDLLLGEDDLVAARWTATGTHSGAWGDVQPTGTSVAFSGVNVFRFGADGKVAELWNHRDDLGLMEQVGAPVYAGAAPKSWGRRGSPRSSDSGHARARCLRPCPGSLVRSTIELRRAARPPASPRS
jgi:SnoaL-like polyketide cyclase